MTARAPRTRARRPGRPRDDRADAAILDAALAVLAERGPAGFTVDEVAERAGCGKATIYRRWPSRAALLLETAHHMGLQVPDVDTGSVRDDLVALMAELGRKVRSDSGRILPAVIAEAAVSPEMADVLRGFIDERRQPARRALERGVERGELPPDVDVEAVLDQLGATVLFREVITRRPVDDDYVRRLVDRVLAGAVAVRGQPN
ncbi:MAG: TetR/AcrR family transcriptional regulator [Thermoanaerobacterales bacterium]|nr:TetR/AcrR family transcriptional regulator [Thermoanaerobacterales bacterium]